MKITRLLVVLFAVALSTGCKKNGGTNANGTSNKLKWYIEDYVNGSTHLTDSFSVSYDNENRLTGLSSPILKFAYAYPSSTTFTLDLYEYGQLSIHEIAYINSNSYVDSTFQFDTSNDTTTEGYIYNGNQLTRDITYNYSSYGSAISSEDDYTYDNNGNVIKEVTSDGYGTINAIATFTYSTYPINTRITPVYLPLGSKYLPSAIKQTDGAGNLISIVTYTYVFDGAGRLTKETDTANDGEAAMKTYVYQ